MARHALSKSRRRALLRAGLTVTAVGAALGAGGAAAQAAPLPLVQATGTDTSLGEASEAAGGAVTGAIGHSLDNGIAPVTHLRLDPLAGTGGEGGLAGAGGARQQDDAGRNRMGTHGTQV